MSNVMQKAVIERTGLVRKVSNFTKYLPYLILIVVVIVVAVALIVGTSSSKPKPKPVATNVVNTACGPYRKDGTVVINNQELNVETAAGSAELTKGLSGRPCLPPNWGMLFDFGRSGRYAIWMKGMRFPIDVAWIDASHKVVALEIDFKPSTYPEQRLNQTPARYVLEINANQSKQLNMDIGSQVHFYKS